MVKFKCEECGRVIDITQKEYDRSDGTCKECGGSFEEVEEEESPDSLIESTCDKEAKIIPVEEEPIEEGIETTKFNPEEKTEFD